MFILNERQTLLLVFIGVSLTSSDSSNLEFYCTGLYMLFSIQKLVFPYLDSVTFCAL